MNKFKLKKQKGASLIEFGILLGLIATVSIASVASLGSSTKKILVKNSIAIEEQLYEYIDFTNPLITVSVADCDASAWRYDTGSNLVYPQTRANKTVDGEVIYISECKETGSPIPLQYTPTGWIYHDDQLFANQTYSITATFDGQDYIIEENYLPDDASNISYTYVSQYLDEQSGSSYYDGCNLIVPSDVYDSYSRPDGTLYNFDTQTQTTVNKGDMCITTAENTTLRTKDIITTSSSTIPASASVTSSSSSLTIQTVLCYPGAWVLYPSCGGAPTTTVQGASGSNLTIKNTSLTNTRTITSDLPYQIVTTSAYAKIDHYGQKASRTVKQYPTGEIEYSDWTYEAEYLISSDQAPN